MDQECYKGRQDTFPLFSAARNGDVDKLCKLIDSGEYDANLESFQQVTALDQATSYGQLDIIKELVKRGANVNHQDFEGWTALHRCCSSLYKDYDKFYAIYEFLIESGADKEILTTSEKSITDIIYNKEVKSKFTGVPIPESETKKAEKADENPATEAESK